MASKNPRVYADRNKQKLRFRTETPRMKFASTTRKRTPGNCQCDRKADE
jgi:hypothetical protein